MSVRRYEPGVYEVTNESKGHSYPVRFIRLGANVFVNCTSEAGTPSSEGSPGSASTSSPRSSRTAPSCG